MRVRDTSRNSFYLLCTPPIHRGCGYNKALPLYYSLSIEGKKDLWLRLNLLLEYMSVRDA
jgi:hypothetical protein